MVAFQETYSTSSQSTNPYSISSTAYCYGEDIPPIQLDSIETIVDEPVFAIIGPFCSNRGLDINLTVVEEGKTSLPENFTFDSTTLILNGTLATAGSITIEVTVSSDGGEA